MRKQYNHLSIEERAVIMTELERKSSIRKISSLLARSPSTISREIKRFPDPSNYHVRTASQAANARKQRSVRTRKLAPGTVLWQIVKTLIRVGWSPEQIAGRLKRMNPDDLSKQVSHETIYAALYALPKGERRQELIESLRQGKQNRGPRRRGNDRRGQIPNMASIHDRPAEVEDRPVPGHWEGDLIKGARNQSAIGTLVERQSRYLLMARMDGADAHSTLQAFSRRLRHVPRGLRKTMTYDRGKEMTIHEELAKILKIQVYFADPYSPWQRGCNENTNGLIRQYLPKRIDLSEFSPTHLNQIAMSLNTRPRKCLDFQTPLEVYEKIVSEPQNPSTVALGT